MTQELIAKLESASEGSRELNVALWDHFGGWSGVDHPPAVTTSIDAALALAERVHSCWSWSVGQNVHHKYWHAYALALDDDRASFQPTQGTAKTPALAICAALLRASAAEGAGE